MPIDKQRATTNPAGGLKIVEGDSRPDHKRSDFFRGLKKVAKEEDRPSRPDSETR